MAESDRGSSPRTFNRLKVSRQEIPASTRIFVFEVCTTALLSRLPLASTDTDTPICSQDTRYPCGIGSNFLVSRNLSAHRGFQSESLEITRRVPSFLGKDGRDCPPRHRG